MSRYKRHRLRLRALRKRALVLLITTCIWNKTAVYFMFEQNSGWVPAHNSVWQFCGKRSLQTPLITGFLVNDKITECVGPSSEHIDAVPWWTKLIHTLKSRLELCVSRMSCEAGDCRQFHSYSVRRRFSEGVGRTRGNVLRRLTGSAWRPCCSSRWSVYPKRLLNLTLLVNYYYYYYIYL